MQVLYIILTIGAIVANFAMTFLAVTAWLQLKRLKNDLREIKCAIANTAMLTATEHLRSTFNELNDMRQTLNRLIEDECFEEAERLKQLLAHAEENAMKSLAKFKERYGSDSMKVEFFTNEKGGNG